MKLIKNYFSILTYIFAITGLVLILIFPKGALELKINQELTTPGLDIFFKYVTNLGDGWILLVIFLMTLFMKYRYSASVLLMSVIQFLLVHINKDIFFKGLPRPKMFFNNIDLHFVEGVATHSYNTFPSGHTATAFSIFFLLAITVNKKSWSVLFFLCAFLVGISRVYLMQHFIIDIYAGAIIGYLATLVAILICKKIHQPFLEKRLRI